MDRGMAAGIRSLGLRRVGRTEVRETVRVEVPDEAVAEVAPEDRPPRPGCTTLLDVGTEDAERGRGATTVGVVVEDPPLREVGRTTGRDCGRGVCGLTCGLACGRGVCGLACGLACGRGVCGLTCGLACGRGVCGLTCGLACGRGDCGLTCGLTCGRGVCGLTCGLACGRGVCGLTCGLACGREFGRGTWVELPRDGTWPQISRGASTSASSIRPIDRKRLGVGIVIGPPDLC
ncbi:MAG TPA: hypothetical protein EYQ08_12060 [Planctomycetes bacterium]|nr:hypothetical protein [Planctomycetota bacterium]